MEIIRIPLTHIREDEVRRYAGIKNQDFSPAMIRAAVQEALCLAKPQGVWSLYPYQAACGIVCSDPPIQMEGEVVRRHLCQADQLAVLAVTIGEDVEESITELFQQGEYTAAVLLDAAATTAVEQTADTLNRLIAKQGQVKGYQLTTRFSPGYGNWSVAVQPQVLTLCQGHAIGIRTTESYMLIPRKSVTAVIGWVPNRDHIESVNQAPSCQGCNQLNCVARKVSTRKEQSSS